MAFNMDPKKCPMPTQDPNVRNKNFKEVALGYTAEMAVNEAKRCLQCKKPACRTGCPVQIDIPAFIAEVAKGDFEAAYQVIAKSSALPAVCGRVCPQENQCEGKCVRGIKGEPVGIGRLERFVADWHRENVHTPAAKPEPNGHKVAVIGAGPSGLTVAGDLAKLGYKVTVYEALHVAGGVLMYGIPEFRLPKDIVQGADEGGIPPHLPDGAAVGFAQVGNRFLQQMLQEALRFCLIHLIKELCIVMRIQVLYTADLKFYAKAVLLTSIIAVSPFPVSQWFLKSSSHTQ